MPPHRNTLTMRNYIAALKFLTAFLFVSSSVYAQTNIEFILKNSTLYRVDTVDAFDLSQTEFHNYDYKDTINMRFNKNNIDCYNIRYHENGKMFRAQIWLDTGNIKIEAHIDSNALIVDTVFNSPTYYMVKNFAKDYYELYKNNDTTAFNNYLLTNYDENIQNPFSLMIGYYYINLNQNLKLNLIKFKLHADKQGDKFNWFFFYPMVVERLNKILDIDKINLNGFTFINKENKKVKLLLRGSDYYVLDFWFLACPPCIHDHKDIKLNYEKLKQKKVELVSISIDDNVFQWKNYLSAHNYNWQNYLQTKNGTITNQLSIHSFPTYIIVNNKGDIIDTYNSFADVEKRFKIDD